MNRWQRAVLTYGALAGLVLTLCPGARAQEGVQPPTVLPGAGVEVVRLEVAVAEKNGRPRTGLRREDFVVLEDGRPQPIVQFQAFARYTTGGPSAPQGQPEPSRAGQAEEAEGDRLPARYVVLAIDDVHMEFDSLVRVRKALERFVEEDLAEEDQVALVTTSGALALSQEFTSDRAALRQVLSRLSPQGRRAEWSSVPRLSEYQAELIEQGDALALEAAVQEILHEGLIQDQDTAELMSRQKAHAVLAEAIAGSRLTLEALEGLCRGLSGITGRKALFLVSDGFLAGLSSRGDIGFDLRRIADAGMRAGVVVYALDTRALPASAPAMDASSIRRPTPQTLGVLEAMRSRSVEATRDAMNALAADTGGFLVANRNDLRTGLRQLLRDTETYYVLAYEPTNTARDGAFRRVEVRLPGVPGVRVRTRTGYFAPDERKERGPDEGAEARLRHATQRRAELQQALVALAPLTGIPVRLAADFVSLDGRSQVVVSGVVDVGNLPFVRRGDRREGTVETSGLVYDEAGRVAVTLDGERSTIDVTDADYERLLRSGLAYSRAVELPRGRYQIRLAARDEATGLLGSVWRRVEVPDLAQGRFATSGLFLLKDEGAAAAELPATPVGAPILHSVQGLPRFGRAENLYWQIHAYNGKRDANGTLDLQAQAAVLRAGSPLATAAPEPMAEADVTGAVAHVSRIRLQRFEPGEYELRVTVTDRNANAIATRAVGFSVE